MLPGQPSGVVRPPRRWMNHRRRRRAGVTPTATLFVGIRYRCAAADSRDVAHVPRSSIFLPVHPYGVYLRPQGIRKNPDAPRTHGYRPLGAVMSILAPPAPGSRTLARRSAPKPRATRGRTQKQRAATAT